MRNAMWVGGGITGMGEIPMLGVKEKGIAKVIRDIFRNGEQGFFYDPSDMESMYQDAAGKVGVNTPGQPAGLILDKSKGLSVGPELVDITNWVERANTTITVTGNKVRIAAIGKGSWGADLNYTTPTISGKRYKVLFNLVTGNLTPSIYARFTVGNATTYGAGTHTLVELSTGSTQAAIATTDGVAGEYVEVELSVVELHGNHAYQNTSAARPILQNNPSHIVYDGVDDKLITNLPSVLTGCTVLRSIPNLGTQVKYNQTLPMLYEDSTNHSGLIAIDRALTRSEQLRLMTELDKKAGTTSFDTTTFKMFDPTQQGFYYDPDDLTTLYQDDKGTVPVTGVGQPVGLILDKSKSLIRGNELLPSKDLEGFTASSDTGLTITNSSITTSSYYNRGPIKEILTVGKWYELEIIGTSDAAVTINTSNSLTAPSVREELMQGFGVCRFLANYPYLYIRNGATGTTNVSLISLKELAGNHAYQLVSASRPVLHAKVNMLFDTEECGTPKWGKTLCTSTQVQELSPTGSKPVSLVACSTDISTFYQASQTLESAPPTRYKFSFYFKGQGAITDDVMSVNVGDASNANSRLEARYAMFNPSNAQLLSAGTDFSVANTKAEADNAVPVGNGWFRVTLSFTTTATVNLTVRAQIRRGTGTGAPASCLLWGFDLRTVNGTASLPSYQKVVDASNYDTVGFPHYLSFDGVDDFLQTNDIDFTATDKVSLFAGVRKMSDAATAIVVELSDAKRNSFVLFAPSAGGNYHYNFRSFGTEGSGTGTSPVKGFPAPHSAVLRATGEISTSTCELLINGGSKQKTAVSQGTGNYGNYPLYIGRRGGTSLPFNGHIYGLIGIGKLLPDTVTTVIEKELAKRTGAELNV